jgi:signal transduction histidine kinase
MSDDSRREAVDDIYSQSRRLARGIEMALDIAQVDGGATAPMAERVEACDVVRRALDRVGPPDQLTVEVPAGLEVMVDRDLAAKALGELIDNACKYGEPPIQVVARDEVRHVAIDVLDRGEGVPPEFEPHLFERFAQASTGSTRTATGMGLGLGLARSLVRAQNGEASYRSRPDGGAVFTLTFPAARD